MSNRNLVTCYTSALFVGMSLSVNAQTLPDAATPGAISEPKPDLLVKPNNDLQLSIPAKKDRPLDLDSGPVIQVKRISLYELGGKDKSQQVLMDNQQVNQIIQDSIDKHVDGFTLGQLQSLTDQVTNFYRQQGWILATVYLPAQEVDSGEVVFHLLPGKLDLVRVQGESSYSVDQLTHPFSDSLQTTLDKNATEASLLTVLDYPGISVSGVLEPGEEVGTTNLNLSVNSEDRFAGIIYLDNKGSFYSGEERLGAGLIFNNPFGLIDQLRLDGMIQNKPQAEGDESVDHALFGGISYTARPFDPAYELSFEHSRNQYDIGRELAEFGFEGKAKRTSFGVKRQLRRSRIFNDYVRFNLNLNDAQTLRDGESESRDKLTSVQFAYSLDYTDGLIGGGYSALNLVYRRGLESTFGSLSNGDEQISRLTDSGRAPMDYSKWKLSASRYQRFIANTSLRMRLDMQYSADPLVSLEQFSIGGSDSVRAYPGAEYMADKGVFASIEWITPIPFIAEKPAFGNRTWGDVLQFSAFFDYGKGYKNEALSTEEDESELYGSGLGIRFAPLDNLELNISVAEAGAEKPSNGREPQIFADLIFQF
ncbi:ShlB/FhaC/HecB family hemolysin secretion/activation protein [Neptuniibacter sp. PT34_22]|uniref:ShlB/FhaC/HecB family hemolysin secretion/activation protein n=1 Tax=Neptuniibacter sp. PT34_22 TaxID=3398205 RepID=UPI0039F6146B